MLEEAKKKWVDELLGVLCAYQITLGWPTETSPFALAYGMEAIILTKIGLPTAKIIVQGQKNENQEFERHLDWAGKARPRVFRSGTLVLRRVFENTAKRGVGKLQANWQRPYVVTKARNLGAYYLQTLDIVPLLCPCNVSNLIGLACEE
ncbi:hypothetical protein CK203_046517 [Vitis vinifera]|uniref:Reverse transcriptase RNase H-like domain-containing protein n=1 Tax=Vitis vinifera TaxID=29760 RepID=A0A438ILG5_VITVI|nr:hypothetical protein CK203_046517 [Vitis vinifera]